MSNALDRCRDALVSNDYDRMLPGDLAKLIALAMIVDDHEDNWRHDEYCNWEKSKPPAACECGMRQMRSALAALTQESPMKPKPPRPIWCVVDHLGYAVEMRGTKSETALYELCAGDRIIRYIPAPTKRRKPRRKGYRAGGMS